MSDESIIDDLLDAYDDACLRGEQVDVVQLCEKHPHLVSEVRRRIAKLEWIDQRLSGDEPSQSQPSLEALRPPSVLAYHTQVTDLKFVARGGLGTVYVGKDVLLNRQVALKFMHPERASEAVGRQYFELEAEVTGRLEHPGVIPLYGAGESDAGVPYYAMRYIDGQTLDARLREFHAQRLQRGKRDNVQFRSMLQAFISICQTIAYAHNRGIVHRDIKPDNVMLGRYGETIVVDWGLAVPVTREARFRVSGEKTLLPQTGSGSRLSDHAAGTPAYMSPEQASNLAAAPASDIYSLGATLFKLLTGVPPITGDSLPEIRSKILAGKFPKPTALNNTLDSALEGICLKAMSLQPQDRYSTALDLAKDVERYLADEPVEAYAEKRTEKLGRFFRRHRLSTFVALIGLSLCVLLASLSAVWLAAANQSERESRAAAEQSRRENLSTSAMFLAKSVAYEIELYWKVLEAEAESSSLRQLVMQANAEKQQLGVYTPATTEELQRWLEKRYIAAGSTTKTLAWVINALDGTQVARVPEAASIGQNFAHRDYFHALGRDLTPEELAQQSPLPPLGDKEVYASAVYQGSNTQTLLITFAVPIWSAPRDEVSRERIGVLAFPVELGEFALGSRAILADTRPDQLRGRAGLILNHVHLGAQGLNEQTPYLLAEDLGRAKQIAADRQTDPMLNLPRSNIVESFFDPVDQEYHLSAIEPVIIRGRRNFTSTTDRSRQAFGDTGWVVIAIEEN
jgi:eukaryotic-like serine/threonine-protein kinase